MFRKIFGPFLILWFSLNAFPLLASSAVDPADVGVGARPLGMGKAYVALSDDASGIFINPAGLSRSQKVKITSMTARLLGTEGIAYYVFGGLYPTDFGVLGAGYIHAATGDIPLTYLDSNSDITQYDSASYNAGLFIFSYARSLNEKLALGANFKFFHQRLGASTTTGQASLEGGTGTGINFDLGIKYDVNSWLTLAFVQQNTLPKSMGGRFRWSTGLEEELASVSKIGVAVLAIGDRGLYRQGKQKLIVSLDSAINLTQKNRPATLHLGAEWFPVKMVALRAGVDQNPTASSALVDNNLTAGVGVYYEDFSFDYSYHQYGGLSDNTTHYFSIGYAGDFNF